MQVCRKGGGVPVAGARPAHRSLACSPGPQPQPVVRTPEPRGSCAFSARCLLESLRRDAARRLQGKWRDSQPCLPLGPTPGCKRGGWTLPTWKDAEASPCGPPRGMGSLGGGRRKPHGAVKHLSEPLVSGGFSRPEGIHEPQSEIPESSQDAA